MPGGNMNIVLGKWTNIIYNEYNSINKKGRWVSTLFEVNNKKLLITIGYWITEKGGEGIYSVKVQLDLIDKQVK